MDKTIRRILVFFLLVIGVFVVVAVDSVRNINRAVAGSDWVNHTHSVILETEALRSALYLGDGAAHTFVVTGDVADRRAGVEALSDVSEHLEIMAALTRNEPPQRDQVARIDSLVGARVAFIRGVLAARQAGNMGAVRTMLSDDAGQPALKEIERAIGRLKDDELALLTERDTASFVQAQMTRWTVWTGVVLDFLLLAGAGWLIRDDITARRAAAAALQEANSQLEAKVRERTAELASANEMLTAENMERHWANQGLEHQLHYNQLIINSINDLVMVLTKATNISRVNLAVVRVTGFEPHELINRPFSSFARLAQEGGAPVLDPIAQAMNEGRDLRDQAATIADRVGRRIPVSVALFPLRDRDKVVGGVVVIQVIRPEEKLEHQI
ncbi:MAG TPA: CHASE3 domain-containing protein [Opitutaceae bacterium]|nr:CHASE3 domain-containing protein [Opitutaceae bacterium]